MSFPICITIFLFILSSIRDRSIKLIKIVNYFYASFFILQAGIVSKIFDFLNCTEFELDHNTTESYLQNNLGVRCYTEKHIIWILLMAVPSMLLYIIITPLSTIIFSFIKGKQIKTKQSILEIDFMMRKPFFKYSSFWFFLNQLNR